ncbi:MAG: bifunctional homocysteine S-methyltransferase/methylenetetrahydrofolate reductase [Sedimentisphaerales bacterium]|nr:bifunctional homocysteine S-methyltransferase/methylenetetrahydrofolate reductase [Sedimentisphaerales bacterium]
MGAKYNLVELLKHRVVLGDGAMGTMLYQYGIFLNRCFDELNISKPEIIKKVHDGYVRAGADFIETNTFGANELKLVKYGLADKVEQINRAGVEIARDSAGELVMVAGSMGPLGREIVQHGTISKSQAAEAFKRQAKALIKAGVDFLILETFSSSKELLIAIGAIRQQTDLPIVAQMTCNENNETIYGQKIEKAITEISNQDVQVVGLNCSVGPSAMLGTFELIKSVTNKPISVQPNAGLPREIDNRTLYMCTPEYMAEYAKRFFEKGARIIGGCCGTTPEHIKEIVRTVKTLDKADRSMTEQLRGITVSKEYEPAAQEPAPLAQKSHIGKKLSAGQKVTTIEITPPRGVNMDTTLNKAKLCAQMGIDAINIPDGPRASSRLSPLVTGVKIQENADIEIILHFCCRDRNLIGMQSDMLGAYAIGLRNILIITGDPPKMGEYPDATGVFDLDSIALTEVLRNLNKGIDVGGNRFSPPLSLSIGVGVNPVASDLNREIDRFKRKVNAGAEFAITQPVFDVQMLFNFLNAIESFKIPIIAGIWPFTSYKNAEFMANEVPGVVVPAELLKRMSKAKDKKHARAIGIEIAGEMVEKITDHVAGFAVSAPFGNVETALAVLGKLSIN